MHDGVSVEAMNLGDERGLGDVLREVAVDEQMPTSADALRFVFTDVCESFRLPTMATASLGTYERASERAQRQHTIRGLRASIQELTGSG